MPTRARARRANQKYRKQPHAKAPGGRHGCFDGELTRRANQRHLFIFPQILKTPDALQFRARWADPKEITRESQRDPPGRKVGLVINLTSAGAQVN
jgi:hypothetical protein